MMNVTRAVEAAVLAALVFCSGALAQYPGQVRPSASSPTYSPYLNLLRPGNTANNYYGLVRPQIDFQNQVNVLQQQYGTLNREINAAPADQPLPPATTGHAAQFMSYSRYYPGLASTRTARPSAAQTTPAPQGRR